MQQSLLSSIDAFDVVHLHLEHPVVKRLLGRFVAQGFVYEDLSRACFAQLNDIIPRIILLGRLCLYGTGAARLYEELIAVAARWIDPGRRKTPLSPYGREAEGNTLELLEKALAKGIQPNNPTIIAKLQTAGRETCRNCYRTSKPADYSWPTKPRRNCSLVVKTKRTRCGRSSSCSKIASSKLCRIIDNSRCSTSSKASGTRSKPTANTRSDG